jgi:hypothetical protein
MPDRADSEKMMGGLLTVVQVSPMMAGASFFFDSSGGAMEKVYLGCAVLGGTVMVCQFLLTLLGLGDHGDMAIDHDVPHDFGHDHAGVGAGAGHDAAHEHDQGWFVGILSFRALVAAVTFFGLGGMIGTASDAIGDGFQPFWLAVVFGFSAMMLVAWMMRGLSKLRADGTMRIDRTVGATGTVYLPVPGERAGTGKVTLTVQGRTVELAAVTEGTSLPTGAKVVAVAVVNPSTVEVAAE